MATQKPQPVTHIYKEVNKGKYKTVTHYELQECNETPIFSELINISKNQNCAQSMPIYWLKIREGKKWTNYITGLFKTSKRDTYKGDTEHKKSLVIFEFSDNESILKINYFKGYYTNDLRNLIH